MKARIIALVATAFTLSGNLASATTIDATLLRTDAFGTNVDSMAMDPITGAFYTRAGYGLNGNTVQVFSNSSSFASGTPSTSFNLGTYNAAGTYITANNGQLYGRTFGPSLDSNNFPNGTTVGTWNATNGNFIALSNPIPNIGGVNGQNTFNWGGFSGPSWMQDSTGQYVLGNINSATWQITKMNPDLSIASTKTFSFGSIGYAFMINGVVYFGSNFGDPHITQSFNFATGVLSSVDFTLANFGGGLYLSDTMYDPLNDTLYFFNTDTNSIYDIADASVAFGASAATPVPAALPLFATGLGGLGLLGWRRKRKAQAAA